jgi:hypothetical protein
MKNFMKLYQNSQNLDEIKHSLRGILNKTVVY